MKVKEFIVIIGLIVAIATVLVILQTRRQALYGRLERICIESGFDGLVSERGRGMYCFRGRDDGDGYETVLVSIVMHYAGERIGE